MVGPIKLCVYILGLRGTSFIVTVAKSDIVSQLAKEILKKKPNDLGHFDADQLPLYKVSLPDGNNLEQLAPQALNQRLDVGSHKISKIFSKKPQEGTVSIVVDIRSVGE
jgi:hypothetical protein